MHFAWNKSFLCLEPVEIAGPIVYILCKVELVSRIMRN